MIRRHFLTALRSFLKHKSSFFINLIGLATGLLCTLLILMWVSDERSVDKFHQQSDRIFRVMEHQRYANGDVFTTRSTPGLLASNLKLEFPEVEYATTCSWQIPFMIGYGDRTFKETGLYADADFFHIFSFPLVEGAVEDVLAEGRNIAISERLAEKLFQGKPALGEMVLLDQENSYRVSGVFQNPPKNSTLQFDYILQAEAWRAQNDWLRNWGSNGPSTLVKLAEGASMEELNDKLLNYIRKYNETSVVDLFLYPFSRGYLYGSFENGQQAGGRIEYVQLFSVIAFFVLIIACINFMNLSTAKAAHKAREVGIRKAIGADRSSLVVQYLIESVLLAGMAVLLAALLIPLILPYFNQLTGKSLEWAFGGKTVLLLVATALVTGLLAGSYPAAYLSSFRPIKVIKNEIKGSLGELWARRGLVVFQFAISIFLIVAVVVVYLQIDFIQSKNLGFEKENLVRMPLQGKLGDNHSAFFEELRKNPKIVSVAASGHGFVGRSNNSSGVSWPGKLDDEVVLFEYLRCDYDLISTMGFKMKEGRTFSREFATDTAAVVINETAAKVMRLESPVGTTLSAGDDHYRVIGVVEDFHFQSLHERVAPTIFWLTNEWHWAAFIRIQPGQTRQALEEAEAIHARYNPGFEFEYDFMDDEYNSMYQSEQRVAALSRYFAGFAVLISCLGLFGLAAFTAERRTKEIGIRKVLGASVFSLIMLLSKDFTRLVLLSILIGLPLAYVAVSNWLQRFAFHIDLSWWFFALSGALALVIAWLTVSSQAYKAANINPAQCLKNE